MSAIDPKLGEPDSADKSRQKSCNACVRSKRRCDKRTPRCTRCAEKNFSCVYQNLPPNGVATASSADSHDDPLQAMDLEDNGISPPHPFDFNTLDGTSSTASPTFVNGTLVMTEPTDSNATTTTASSINLNLDANMPFDFNSVMDFLNADPVQGGEMQLWETPQPPTVPKTIVPEVPYMGSVCCGMDKDDMLCMSQDDFKPWQIHEPDSRIGFLVNYCTKMHVTFAQTKQTPFLHRHLYRHTRGTPRPLMAAYTAISAYAGRTETNKGWAIRAICEGAAEVLKSSKDAAASAAMSGHDKLARTQALWMLQTIRCFDGDIALRAQAERDMGVLKRWLEELEGLRDNLDDVHLLDDLAVRQRPPRSWEVWVFNESVRRTILMGHMFTSLFEILKSAGEAEPDPANWMAPHRWTFSKHLWDAQSSPAFFSAWREKPLFMINSFFVNEVAKVARPLDVDEFARLFLTLNFGVEETKHFMLEA
ncbi:C6 zinc finger domain protein [Colletotrichum truncatum]|uniref:C6 zinc finger domain protein n=1 Tax=Colletotrichum truncatum TaxID=5467 RepID=A0ACC3YX64_COLTU|nr:C6 zinc finger domain protein [Colletotrichum truncatum]KAF6792581.1 C6 zinc finger domain protein [Colletotrichum truncatum]